MTALGFSYDMAAVDRDALLADAAERLQRLEASNLGVRGRDVESASAALARELTTESAKFASYPDVHRITDEHFLARGLDVPVRFTDLAARFDFFWVRFPVALRPLHKWAFTRLEVGVDLCPSDGVPDHLRPRAYRVLPDKRFETLLETRGEIDVQLDGDFELSGRVPVVGAEVAGAEASVGAGAAVKARGGVGASGGFRYRLKKAKIDHTPTGMDQVFWRLDDTELFEEDSPEMVVIVQLPKDASDLRVAAALQAYRRLSVLTAGFQAAIRGLPRALRNYFAGGAPLRCDDEWDLTPVVRPA